MKKSGLLCKQIPSVPVQGLYLHAEENVHKVSGWLQSRTHVSAVSCAIIGFDVEAENYFKPNHAHFSPNPHQTDLK